MEDKIIELYKRGIGSTTIVKMLPVSKKKVLKVLHENNLIKKKVIDYSDITCRDGRWYGVYKCSDCKVMIECSAIEKYHLHRNLKKKNICKKCSLKKQIGEGNPFYGKTHTKETIQKLSDGAMGIKRSDHMSDPFYKEMLSKMKKELWGSGSMEHVRKKMSNLMKKRHENGELTSFNRSKAEDEIILIIEGMGIVCTPNFRITSKIYDIYIPSLNLIIEYNGDYWHCNPEKYNEDYYNQKKGKLAKDIWEYDKMKLHLAEKNNYNYLIIWEKDYKKNPDIVKEIIKNYERTKKSHPGAAKS